MKLTLRDSFALKGVALVLLLVHHLFWRNTELYDDIHLFSNYYLFQSLGEVSKCCVALFVFLSGYGLTCKYMEGRGKMLDIYVHRYVKLFFNYWLIFLLFVPVSVLWLGPTLSEAYGNRVVIRLIMDFLCISGLLNYPFYNTTWWFMSCIIGLYILYPVLVMLINKGHFFMLLTFSVVMYVLPIDYPTKVVWICLPSFLCGIKFRVHPFPKMNRVWGVILFTMLCSVRLVAHYGTLMDVLITVFIVSIIHALGLPELIKKTLCFIGERSMLIFLFHTFLFHIWFRDFIYLTRSPIIILLMLLLSSLLLAEVINMIKRVICFNTICNRVESYILSLVKQ